MAKTSDPDATQRSTEDAKRVKIQKLHERFNQPLPDDKMRTFTNLIRRVESKDNLAPNKNKMYKTSAPQGFGDFRRLGQHQSTKALLRPMGSKDAGPDSRADGAGPFLTHVEFNGSKNDAEHPSSKVSYLNSKSRFRQNDVRSRLLAKGFFSDYDENLSMDLDSKNIQRGLLKTDINSFIAEVKSSSVIRDATEAAKKDLHGSESKLNLKKFDETVENQILNEITILKKDNESLAEHLNTVTYEK